MNHDEAEEYLRRHGPLYGFLVACAIMTVMVYALMLQSRADSIVNCEQRNTQMAEVNLRAPEINSIAVTMTDYMEARLAGDRSKIAEGVPVVKATIADLATVTAESVPLTDCSATFERPWPLSTFD